MSKIDNIFSNELGLETDNRLDTIQVNIYGIYM